MVSRKREPAKRQCSHMSRKLSYYAMQLMASVYSLRTHSGPCGCHVQATNNVAKKRCKQCILQSGAVMLGDEQEQ